MYMYIGLLDILPEDIKSGVSLLHKNIAVDEENVHQENSDAGKHT